MDVSSVRSGALPRQRVRLAPARMPYTHRGAVIGAAVIAWLVAAVVTLAPPDRLSGSSRFSDTPVGLPDTSQFGAGAAAVAGLIVLWLLVGFALPALGTRLRFTAPWLVVTGVLVAAYEVATAKNGWLPTTYFPSPQEILSAYPDDGALLLQSVGYSMRLVVLGVLIGAVLGFFTGLAMGWSKRANYWLLPIVRTIGPVPASAWLPLAFVLLPTGFEASIFLIALGTWFPVTIQMFSGVGAVNRRYYDIARTLGARERFLIWKIAVPSAMPSLFLGLFMAFGTSFVLLLAAETTGVKAGLGWYIQWQQSYMEYNKMWACLLIMVVLFSSVITILFRVQAHVLSWQKGLVHGG